VGVGQRVGQGQGEVQELLGRECALGEALGQAAALDVLEGDVVAALGRTDLVDRGDVRVVQGRRRARLAHEARAARP